MFNRKSFILLLSSILLLSLILLSIWHVRVETNILTEKELKLYERAVIEEGDTAAYHILLRTAYFQGGITSSELLLYSTIIAYGYNYPPGYAQIFFSYIELYKNRLSKMPENIAAVAVENLVIAADKGYIYAQELVEQYSIKSREDYLAIIEEMLNNKIFADIIRQSVSQR